ncbi:hypothetical protein [Myxococcus sp. AB056]|uniref:hypothetical protein n=1 Tax=Myxococcus sp. AB056 TaxID=2562792 RepID=UPI0011474F45|nr:hypothetical protein [Myxococcus sp. AB056]
MPSSLASTRFDRALEQSMACGVCPSGSLVRGGGRLRKSTFYVLEKILYFYNVEGLVQMAVFLESFSEVFLETGKVEVVLPLVDELGVVGVILVDN